MAALDTTIFGVSKTTIVGVLSFLTTTFTVITAMQVPIIFNTNANHTWAWISGASTIGLALCRAWVGLLQSDAPPLPAPSPQAMNATQTKAALGVPGQSVKSLLLGALLLGGMAGLTGCPSGSQLQKIAQAAHDAEIVAQGFQQGEVIAFKNGQVPLEDHVFIEKQMVTLATLGTTLDGCIRTSGSKDGAVECARSAVNTVDSLNSQGAFQIKSAQARTDYQIAMLGLRTALSTIVTLEGGTPPPLAAAARTGGM